MSSHAWPHDGRLVSRSSALAAAGIYLTVALVGRGLPSGELFPFFSWDLFSRVPGDTLRAAIYVDAVAGVPLETPEELLGSSHVRGSKIVASQLTNELLLTVRSGQVDDGLVTVLVANHLPEDVAWSLRVESYEPVQRYRHGAVATVAAQRFVGEVAVEESYWTSTDGAQVVSSDATWTFIAEDGSGDVEHTTVDRDGTLHVSGWAGDTSTGSLPVRVLVLHGDEVLGAAVAGFPRFDIRQVSDSVALLASGFSGSFQPGRSVDPARIRVVALFADGTARRLP